MTARLRAKSVTPPVPSPLASVALVCWKSDCEAYRMIGFRSRNSWFSTLDSRAYERSAIRAASSAAVRSRSYAGRKATHGDNCEYQSEGSGLARRRHRLLQSMAEPVHTALGAESAIAVCQSPDEDDPSRAQVTLSSKVAGPRGAPTGPWCAA